MRTRAERRKNDRKKALRKKGISEHNYGFEYYDNVHQYSKNKIHCSCSLCTGKTNSNGKHKIGNFTHADKVKHDYIDSQMEEYRND